MMNVEEILDRKGRHLYEVSPDSPVRDAIAMLAAWKVGTTLVTDLNGKLVGIVSERDLVRAFNALGSKVMKIRVRDLMTQSVITCGPETSVGDALSLMARHRIRHLPVKQEDELLGLISIRDVLEHRLQSLEEHFATLVEAKQEALRARDEAERASRAKSEFLANMSHELRTPLNAVIGFSDIIARELLGPADETYRQYATHIHASGQHLLSLVNDVLDLSKISSGLFELDEGPVDLTKILRDCSDVLGVELTQRELTLRVSLPQRLPPLTADALRLKQVLLNLLSNATKFSPLGGTVEVRVEIVEFGDLTVSVIDQGIGMRAEDIPLALEPFHQIDGDATHAHEGTGLGLPIVKMLIEKHGGTFALTSAPGEGTTASCTIPGWRLAASTACRVPTRKGAPVGRHKTSTASKTP
jgi:signal transduction histidine kinase